MRRFKDWLYGWYTTIHMMIHDRETYVYLRDFEIPDPDDFEEVDRPSGKDGNFRRD